MKSPDTYLTNTVVTAGRSQGAAKNNPGDNTGTGADKETFNDPAYAIIATIESYKESGISDTDETTVNSDFRDSIEEMVAKKVSGIAEWESTTTYTTHQLVMYKGLQFYNHNITGNLAKPPLENPSYWYYAGSPEKLIEQYFNAEPLTGGMHDIANRSHGNYQQSALIGKYRMGGKGDDFYNFYRVALDGTQVTGNANLEAIFDVGGLNQYFRLDLYAPDSGGTRTLLDVGDYVFTPQSSGGDADTVGELVEDQFQGHRLQSQNKYTFVGGNRHEFSADGNSTAFWENTTQTETDRFAYTIVSDGTNGTPRTGSTTHGKRFTTGTAYIIVAVPA